MSYSSLLTNTITVWEVGASNGYGNFSFSAPVQLSCRYQNGTQIAIDSLGQEYVSTATIYTTSQLTLNSFVYNGVSAETNPQLVTGAYRIRNLYTTLTPNDSIIVYRAQVG